MVLVSKLFWFWEKEENVEILQILGVFKTPYHKKEGVMGEMKSRTGGLEKRAASSCPLWLCPCPDTPEITPSTLRSRDTENKEFVFSFLLCSSLHFQAPKAGSALLGQVRNQFLKKAEQKIAYNVAPGG